MAIANIYCTYLRALALLQNLKMYNLNVVIYGAQEGQGLFFKYHFYYNVSFQLSFCKL